MSSAPGAGKRRARIAVDFTTGVWPGAGVARYTRSLVAALAEVDPDSAYTLFYGGRGLPRDTPEYAFLQRLLREHGNLRARELPGSARALNILWNRLRAPISADRLIGGADVLHAPDFVAPPVARARTVVTIHDLTFLALPEVMDPGNRAYLAGRVPGAVRRAGRVVAVSEATRRDVISRLGVAPERVVTVPNGVDARFRLFEPSERARAQEEVRPRLGLPARYLLHVGTVEPRKNLARLVRAYAGLVAQGADCGHDLVLAGRRGWMVDPIFAAVRASGLQARIHFLDYVPESDLPALYNLATLFVYPSLYEGFGLPALEAMACGAPVITSRTPALMEVTGDAARLVDPLDEAALAAGMAALLADEAARGRLRAAGLSRAAQYPWTAAARRMVAVYRSLL
jgi:glycosyltransferase involved in cell wall biosynthesis